MNIAAHGSLAVLLHGLDRLAPRTGFCLHLRNPDGATREIANEYWTGFQDEQVADALLAHCVSGDESYEVAVLIDPETALLTRRQVALSLQALSIVEHVDALSSGTAAMPPEAR